MKTTFAYNIGVAGIVVCLIFFAMLIISGWVFACRGNVSSEKTRLAFLFAIIGTALPPFQIVPLILNAQ